MIGQAVLANLVILKSPATFTICSIFSLRLFVIYFFSGLYGKRRVPLLNVYFIKIQWDFQSASSLFCNKSGLTTVFNCGNLRLHPVLQSRQVKRAAPDRKSTASHPSTETISTYIQLAGILQRPSTPTPLAAVRQESVSRRHTLSPLRRRLIRLWFTLNRPGVRKWIHSG